MAEFVDPFSGLAPERKLSDRELARAIRMALAAEEEPSTCAKRWPTRRIARLG